MEQKKKEKLKNALILARVFIEDLLMESTLKKIIYKKKFQVFFNFQLREFLLNGNKATLGLVVCKESYLSDIEARKDLEVFFQFF